MQLVVDASVLVGELLRAQGRERVADARLELFLAEHAWAEVKHELPRRTRAFATHHGLADDRMHAFLKKCIVSVEENPAIVPEVTYAPLEDEARWRSRRDPNDWPTVALALTLDVAIWTEDRDFFGIGVSTWSTTTVRAWLDRSP